MTKTFTIRNATPEDAAMLAELGLQTFMESFGHMYADEDLQPYLAESFGETIQRAELEHPSFTFYITEVDGKAVAYAKVGPCKLPVENPLPESLELHRIYVLKSHHDLGIGKALMKKVMELYRARKASTIYLGMWQENHKAKSFYQGFGFKVIGEYKYPVGKQLDNEYILQLAA